jgi:hypothetical protein
MGLFFWVTSLKAQELYIGSSSVDITPALPVALMGQFHLRLADTVESPLVANIIALEAREGSHSLETAIFVACDLVVISPPILAQLRAEVHKIMPDFDTSKIIVTATHTHTAPVLDTLLLKYPIPEKGVTQIDEYLSFFSKQVAGAIIKAWESRSAGSVTWGLSHAVVGYNRRSVYANGNASLYGGTNTPEFRNIEGYEDHDVNSLFFWNKAGKLVAMSIDIPCPAQEVEGLSAVNADYWHDTRIALKKRFGEHITVVGWVGASGDQSPHLMYRQGAEERMRKLANRTRMEEIGRRITQAVDEAYEIVKNDRHTSVPMVHKVEILPLPMRKVTEAEYTDARKNHDEIAAMIAADPKLKNEKQAQMLWYYSTVELFEKQQKNPEMKLPAEIHVLRIGDAVICTSPFELYVDYGIQIQGRSKALQTFVVQLAGAANYLPTEKAVKGGGYSAIVQSTPVGPEGGQILVNRTVELIDALWEDGE